MIFQLWVLWWELICPVVVQNFGLFRLFPALVLPGLVVSAERCLPLATIHSVLFQKSARRGRQVPRRCCCSGSVMRTSLWSLVTTNECLIVPLGNETCGQINIQIAVSNGASILCRCSTLWPRRPHFQQVTDCCTPATRFPESKDVRKLSRRFLRLPDGVPSLSS